MKKFFAFLCAVLLIAGTVYAWQPVSPNMAGIIKMHGGLATEPNREFCLVRVVAGSNYSGAIGTDNVRHVVSDC
jgi:hypothetical protein